MRKSGVAASWLLPLLLAGAVFPAAAQGKLEAHYVASLAGIPIGKGSWVVDVGDGQYTAAASGMTTGLVRFFTGGSATGAAQGTLAGGQPAASNYAATIKTSRHADEVRFKVDGGVVKDVHIEPPQDANPKRIPVTDLHRRGVLDPMTGALFLMPGTGDMRVPKACEHTVPVFDGKLRYDLQFAFKRMETVQSEKGYVGPAVVCSVSFTPIAGFVPNRATVKYLARPHDMEVWLVPIAGTRVMVPFRAQIETPIGLGVVEATHFVATAAVAAKVPKTQ